MVMGTGEELGTELVDKVGEFARDTHHKVLKEDLYISILSP